MAKDNLRERQRELEISMIENSQMELSELYKKYGSSREGLSVVDIDERLEEYGKNVVEVENENTLLHKLREAIINPFNVVLFIVAIITFITDVVLATKIDYATFILILSTILISALISLTQQLKSDDAASKLRNMITNNMEVIRDDVQYTVDLEEVVPGDIVKLSSGDMIPGDVRFIETKDLFIDQASLTGESNPVEKFSVLKEYESITDLSNVGFMGTNIVSGSAVALVLATGNNTYFGSMAKSMYSVNEKNSFEKGLDSISQLLIKFMIVLVPIVLLINILTTQDFVSSLLFAITIAVGLTPEMLPVITTSTLAKGAVEMSKKKTIVKRLSAIQTFGQMDILCTDKTGTLTEDEVILERYMDVRGNESIKVLRHAFLNSYFQTGLKNLIDLAIINRAEREHLNVLKERYRREDEIGTPFCITYDFDSETDGCVTVRDRDTMEQVRLPIDGLRDYLREKVSF